MASLRRVLIANRGEIAIRIASAAHGLGLESVAVYPTVDQYSLHTRSATTSVELPLTSSGQPVDAYLSIDAILDAAKRTHCDCIHPGYGFLSENPEFAAACHRAGLTFIGPSADALALFGDKVRARQQAMGLDIPVVPGSESALTKADDAVALANELGFPVMLKAAAGGGGRGMRAVESADDLNDAFARCQSEAQAAFGNGALFMEKLVVNPRHIEVQVLADEHGNAIHLHERDCSIQLRNQKVVEIAPAPNLDPALRQSLFTNAIKLVTSANYANAGTVEFLVVPESGQHYFIECNPRIQVEHTITEEVVGVDLVELQFRIAAGESLSDLGLTNQDSVSEPRGFAIQCRLVATGPGTLTAYKEPSGPGVRVDACGYLGYTPPGQFDPLLAKVIGTSGSEQSYRSAIERTARALGAFHLDGLPTNTRQLTAILEHRSVGAGDARTTLLTNEPELGTGNVSERARAHELLAEQAKALGVGARSRPTQRGVSAPSLDLASGEVGVECPMSGSVLEIVATVCAEVAAGDARLNKSAKKIETTV
ncbi:MAG: biotin carboxylase N-terminal domain-containing protein, partial [Pseudomonadota bacterium]